MRSFLRQAVVVSWFAMLLACAGAWASTPSLPQKFDATRDAIADVELAKTLARAQGKRIFVDVGGEWCVWCHVFDRFIASNAPVRTTLAQHYVVVKVNWSRENRNEALLSRWPKALSYPSFYVLDERGNVLASQPSGAFEAGNDYDEAKVLAFLRRYAVRG